jgi:hypothetical protein
MYAMQTLLTGYESADEGDESTQFYRVLREAIQELHRNSRESGARWCTPRRGSASTFFYRPFGYWKSTAVRFVYYCFYRTSFW